jgi:hypothetical protein
MINECGKIGGMNWQGKQKYWDETYPNDILSNTYHT